MDRRKFLYPVMAGIASTTTMIALTETSCNTGTISSVLET